MNQGEVSQVENLQTNLLPEPASEPDADRKPRMPFVTNYELTREREDALVKFAIDRMGQIEGQMRNSLATDGESGYRGDASTVTGKGEIYTADPESFIGKREKYTARYYNHVDDRANGAQPGADDDTIFNHSNLTASLSQRITRQMIAKAVGFFLGAPDDIDWFSAEAVGAEDEALSEKLKRHARWKFNECGIKPQLVTALEFAFVRGEAVVKTTHQRRSQIYKKRGTVLVDENGEPVLDKFGDYIEEGSPTVPEMIFPEVPPQDPAAMPMNGAGSPDPMLMPEPVPSGRMLLKRDGVTVIPKVPTWKQTTMERRLTTFAGPEDQLVYFKDFLCPLDAVDVQTADLVAHVFDMSLMQLAERFQSAEGEAGIANMRAAVQRLQEMAGDGAEPKSAARQPRGDFKEQDTAGSRENPTSQFAEVWLTYDADGDGIQEEIMLVVDRQKKVPIFYEYAANVTTRGLRPFTVLRPIAVDHRWYGMGAMEYLDHEQENVDLQINRRNFADSAAGRVTLFRPYNTYEGQRNPNLKMHWGGAYTPLEGKKMEDVLETAYLENDGEFFMDLLNKWEQYMMLKGGVMNGADQEASSLPTADTATGINDVRESNEEVYGLYTATLFRSMVNILRATAEVTYANMNEEEVFSFFNGQAEEVLALRPEDVRDLALNVTLVLSRTEQRKTLESGVRAEDAIDRFYSRPLPLQERTKTFARQQLKALKVPSADTIIEPLDPLAMAPTVGPDGKPLPGNVEPMPAQSVI